MRRYVFDISKKDVQTHDIDVAIIGSGLAGLYSAYHLDESLSCALFTKEEIETSSSSLAQGGIAAVTEKDDNFTYHFQDTINAGAGMCDEKAVRIIVEEGPKEIEELLALGANFDLDSKGNLLTTREGGHGMSRILHAGGDATGLEMVRTLKETVKRKKSVALHENSFVADIITDKTGVVGLMVYENGGWHLYATNHVILASGGLGQIYRYTTNPSVATGDGFALAERAGAAMENMEFIQFHPTGLYTPENRNKQCFLISEAVRGEGGILLNDAGERFMKGRHPLAELAPRDIVAREIYNEIQNQKSPFVKLDITHKSKDFLKSRFPTIYNTCKQTGIDISKDYIPVGPVQHYMMGGVKSDLMGKTNVNGLLVCGEVASTGVHGANRLASNSTLECLVFGRRCAKVVSEAFTKQKDKNIMPVLAAAKDKKFDTTAAMISIKGLMIRYCGILRSDENLKYAAGKIDDLFAKLRNARLSTIKQMELYNMTIVAKNILKCAQKRKNSVGAHFRTDEGETSDD